MKQDSSVWWLFRVCGWGECVGKWWGWKGKLSPDCERPYKPYEQMSLNFIPLARRRQWRSLNRKATLWHFLLFRRKILAAEYMKYWWEENWWQGHQGDVCNDSGKENSREWEWVGNKVDELDLKNISKVGLTWHNDWPNVGKREKGESRIILARIKKTRRQWHNRFC